MALILVVDDDRDTRVVIKNLLVTHSHEVIEAEDAKEAFDVLDANDIDVAIVDMLLKGMSGIDILKKIKKELLGIPVIIFSGHANIPSAVEAIKLGAFDYLVKPFSNDEFILIVEKALKERKLSRQFEALREHIYTSNLKNFIPSVSPAMKRVEELAKQVSTTDLSVLISGPSGCGKEVMARFIHSLSHRRKNQFVALDCGTLPENLVESELFGYERGAFTGADRKKDGLFEIAFGGTLFLDEISNLSFSTQAKLLRVLQEKKIRHLGGKKDIIVDVRIITASNKILPELIKEGKFREDLYHRINQFSIELPALSERIEDIKFLSLFFLEEANKILNKKVKQISEEALKMLENYSWPGNIRELKNIIIKAVLTADKIVLPENLDKAVFKNMGENFASLENEGESALDKLDKTEDFNLKKAVKKKISEIERDLIQKALQKTEGNKIKAAKLLGIDRKSLYIKLEKLNL